jgi:predicted dehydrogenase
MNLALLGFDDTTIPLARAAAASGHAIVSMCEVEGHGPQLPALVPHARRLDHWESLLAARDVDAVIVARGKDEEQRVEQLRKLIQAGVPLLVAHPVCRSMLSAYELDMIRCETRSVILPFLPARWHAATDRLARLTDPVADGGIAPLAELIFVRALPDRRKDEVTAWFARDMDLVRAVCGELDRLSSMAPHGDANPYANLGVQLSGPAGVLVRWSVEPTEGKPAAQLTLRGENGKAVLEMPPAAEGVEASWGLALSTAAGTTSETFPPWDAASAALERLAHALAGGTVAPTWVDACRSIELAETIDRSLAKGRTIDLYYEDHNEEATFKGTMTSLGCGLLVVSLVSVVVAAVAAQMGMRWAGYWLYVLAGVFGLFLLLQLLKLVCVGRPSAAALSGETTAEAASTLPPAR